MGLRRAATAAAAVCLLLAAACQEAPEPERERTPEPPTAAEVRSCLEERGVSVRERRRPSYRGATDELIVGERRRAGVRVGLGVLFFESDADVQEALNTARIVGDPAQVAGRVIVIPAGPGFEEAEQALIDCLG